MRSFFETVAMIMGFLVALVLIVAQASIPFILIWILYMAITGGL